MFQFFHSFFWLRHVWIAVAFVVSVTASSCRSAKEVIREVEVPIHDTTYVVKNVKDSVFVDRFVKEYVKGDTVFFEKYITRYAERVKTDTVRVYKEVPVQTTVEVEKVVKTPLKWWQKGLMLVGILSLMFGAVYVWLRIKF